MFKESVFVLFAVAVAGAVAAPPEIFLPPDADIVTIVGNGFSLQVNQIAQIKKQWGSVASETAEIKTPRFMDSNHAPVNSKLYERVKQSSIGDKTYGPLEDDLLRWIEKRASTLADRIARYKDEIDQYNEGSSKDKKLPQKLVVEILLLNTLTDLENITKENLKKKGFRSLNWIKNQVNSPKMGQLRAQYEEEITRYVESLMMRESGFKSSNKPTDEWLTLVRAIKRVLHEQRFSEDLNKKITTFLSGSISQMERLRVYDIFLKEGNIKDTLYYEKAKGRVPLHFPFASQDAITNEI